MKNTLLRMLLFPALVAQVRAQGTINIDNLNNTNLSSMATSSGLVFTWGANNQLAFEDNRFSLELLGGPNAGSLVSVATLTGTNQTFCYGSGLFGDIPGATYTVPGVPGNGIATLEILAWEGDFASYAAANAGGGNAAQLIFQNPTGGGGIPPAPPADLIGMPALALGDPLILPYFTLQPQNRTNLAGSTATFTVTVTDTFGNVEPGSIVQWQENGTNLINGGHISGVNSDTLTIANVADGDAGQYRATAYLGGYTGHSLIATLTVIDPPTLALKFNGGPPRVTLTGAANHSFLVQYSTDLTTTNWVNLFSVTLQNSSAIQFTDPSGVGDTARFYRAIMQ